jgi:hypothetical protein
MNGREIERISFSQREFESAQRFPGAGTGTGTITWPMEVVNIETETTCDDKVFGQEREASCRQVLRQD